MKLFAMIFVGFCAWITFIPFTHGTGISTHMDAGERASKFFNLTSDGVDYNALLRLHGDALQAGSPYPDAYWSTRLCYDGNYRQVSEDTHWTPFLNASVNYIRRVYPKPWDWYTEKLVVFLLGIAGHQAQDVTWHGHDLDQGFLDAMGAINYHGSFADAHSDGDLGADILTVFQTDTSFLGVIAKWYIPVDDLLNIYEELYGQPDRISSEVVENCTRILFLERFGESLGLIDLLYPSLGSNSPFILDWLSYYFLGGVDDMAVWSTYLWNMVVTMLDKGTSACDLQHNPIYMRCNETDGEFEHQVSLLHSQEHKGSRNEEDISNGRYAWDFDENDVVIERTDRGVFLSLRHPFQDLVTESLEDDTPFFCNGTCQTPVAFYTAEHLYSRLGKNVVSGDVNGDGFVDAVISAPSFSSPGNYQQGRVYIIYGTVDGIPETDGSIEMMADLVLTGQVISGSFGTSVAVVDFNADGLNDLAISAPTVGSDNIDYRGQVYVYLNEGSTGLPDIPSITIDCTERNCNFGFTLETGDLNGDGFDDLIVGSPFAASGGLQRGLVGIFYASSDYTAGTSLTDLDFNWRYAGQQNFEWFGFSLSSIEISGSTWLLSGAPAYRLCTEPGCSYTPDDVQSIGRVYVFKTLALLQIIEGETALEQFGFAVKLASWNGLDLAFISSTSGGPLNITDDSPERNLTQPGIVRIYEVSGDGVDRDPLLILEGDRSFSRFGTKFLVYNSPADGSENLIIAAPFRSEDLLTDRESGRVFLYQNLTIDASEQEGYRIFGIHEDKARFGSSLAVVASANKVQLIVGIEHYTYVSRLGGAVGIVDISS